MHTLTYHDWTAFVDAVEAVDAVHGAAHDQSEWRLDKSWTLGASYASSVDLARNGWPAGRDCIHELASAYFDKLASTIQKTEYVRAVVGDILDVGAYLAGDPECCLVEEFETVEGPGRKNVRIVYNGTASAGIEADVLLAKGAAVAALAQLLEYAGHGVEIVLAYGLRANNGSGLAVETYVTIKTPDQPMDLGRVGFALAHPATFRRLAFRLWEGQSQALVDACGFRSHGGYGCIAPSVAMTGDVVIGSSMYGEAEWTNPASARAWVAAELAKQGVNVTLPAETEEPTQAPGPRGTPMARRRRGRRRYY